MKQLSFKYVDRCDIEKILPQMFEILHTNMSVIAPTNNSYESDFRIWASYIIPSLHEVDRETILLYADFELVGYLRYFLNVKKQSFLIEDIQIKAEFQGTGVLSSCLKWLLPQLPKNVFNCIEAYVDKRNVRSRTIMEHFGLKCIGENKNGVSLCLSGDYLEFYGKFC